MDETLKDNQNDKKRKSFEFIDIDSNNKKICIASNSVKENNININNVEDIKIDKIKIEGRDPLLRIIKQMNQVFKNLFIL